MNPVIEIPQVTIVANGVILAVEDVQALGEVRVHQRLSLPTQCELTFMEPQGPLAGAEMLLPGTDLRVTMADGSVPVLFEGQVTALECEYGPGGQRLVRVRAYDILHRLRKRQPVRSHLNLTLTELAETLIADLGLTVRSDDDSPLYHHLVQYHQSDLALMAQVAESCGLYYILREGVLNFITLKGTGAEVPLHLGASLIETRIEINSDTVSQTVTTTGWDPQRTENRHGVASQSRSGRKIPAEPQPDVESGDRMVVAETAQTDQQLEAISQAELDRRAARCGLITGVAEGNPQIVPGARICVSGVADALAGVYVVTGVIHTIDREKGFVSEFDTCPPVPVSRLRDTRTSWGRVSRVDDPEALGRVRVILPNYNDIETDWLPVLIPGAGAGKGLVALPDVDDQVLLLMINADAAQAVVLGGLYGTQGPPDTGVVDGAVKRYTFLTPGGQRVRLDDEHERILLDSQDGSRIELTPDEVRIEDRTGSRIELTPDICRLWAKTDLILEAPGQSVTIRGEQIDFRRG